MTFTTRLGLFLVIALAGVVAWQWNGALDASREATQAAVDQFQDAGAFDRLHQHSLAQTWWPFAWPAALVLLGAALFWDDLERWWKRAHDRNV